MVQWMVAGAVLFVALAALAPARRLGRRLELVTKGCRELLDRNGELEARVRRLDPETARENEPEPLPAEPVGAFFSLSALER